jgi:hypothetical protein
MTRAELISRVEYIFSDKNKFDVGITENNKNTYHVSIRGVGVNECDKWAICFNIPITGAVNCFQSENGDVTIFFAELLLKVTSVIEEYNLKQKTEIYLVQFVELITKEVEVKAYSINDAIIGAEMLLDCGNIVKESIEPKEKWIVKVAK